MHKHMKVDVVRAWKDERYRLSLTEEQRALLPDHPAGLVEIADEDLKSLGGVEEVTPCTCHCCCSCCCCTCCCAA